MNEMFFFLFFPFLSLTSARQAQESRKIMIKQSTAKQAHKPHTDRVLLLIWKNVNVNHAWQSVNDKGMRNRLVVVVVDADADMCVWYCWCTCGKCAECMKLYFLSEWQHSFLDPFWRPLEGPRFPLFRWLINPPWSQTSTQQGAQ